MNTHHHTTHTHAGLVCTTCGGVMGSHRPGCPNGRTRRT